MHFGCLQTPRYLAAGLVLCASLAACGGGGGGGAAGGNPPTPSTTSTPSTTPTASTTPASATTNASGKVVDDTSGAALAGVQVVLEPWTAGATPLPSPQATTDSNGNFTLNGAPNGHYLLVVGTNSASDTNYTTVHDNVTFSGGNQTLAAPTLPSMFGYTAPTWESNGTYRLSHIDANRELPCFQRFNADRVSASQPQVPLDEWTMENVRTNNANTISSQPTTAKYISSQNGGVSSGVPGCNAMIDAQFPPATTPYGADPRVAWFGGAVIFGTTSYVGAVEAPFDPRTYNDPNYPTWP